MSTTSDINAQIIRDRIHGDREANEKFHPEKYPPTGWVNTEKELNYAQDIPVKVEQTRLFSGHVVQETKGQIIADNVIRAVMIAAVVVSFLCFGFYVWAVYLL